MKNKQLYLTRASFAILAFVMLGYVVRFYPEQLVVFDQPIQSAIRGSLPNFLTSLFKNITLVGNTSTQVILVLAISAFLYFVKKWKVEAGLVALSGVLAGVLIVVLKNIYDRPRPSIEHLV
ncbi:MAG: phosphatase PAP2 family protein, partial [Streptococcus sp.]|nr:phosphatase PAP2 family protein [Streptococcus sp.]